MRNYRNNLFVFLLALLLLHTYAAYGETHRVVRGDTLYSIAKKYSLSVRELMVVNGIENPSSLSVGTDLIIPGTEESAPSAGKYTVVSGDTYYSISRKHGMDVPELLALNNLTVDDILSIGQTLSVAGAPAANSPSEPLERSEPSGTPVREERGERREQPAPAASGPSLVLGLTGKDARRPEWPVTGSLYSVNGDFEGVMIESAASSYVEAVSEGEVVWAGPYWEFGQIALIESDGYIYFYGGNSDIFVNVGQKITVGTRIGRLENREGKGNLYFTIFKEGKVIDLAMAGN